MPEPIPDRIQLAVALLVAVRDHDDLAYPQSTTFVSETLVSLLVVNEAERRAWLSYLGTDEYGKALPWQGFSVLVIAREHVSADARRLIDEVVSAASKPDPGKQIITFAGWQPKPCAANAPRRVAAAI